MRRGWIRVGGLIVAGATWALDYLAKRLFFLPASPGVFGLPLWLVRLTDHHNFGLTFDLPFPLVLLIGVSGLIVAGLLYWLLFGRGLSWKETLAIGLVIGGALGNLWDRLALGFVRDWLLLFGRSAVNLADCAVILGVILLAWKTRRPKEA